MAFVVPAIASAIGSIGSAAVAGAGALGSAAATGIGAIGSSASLGTLSDNVRFRMVGGDERVDERFGDGVRCVDGNLIRMGIVQNNSGASQFPNVGQASISVRGNTPPGSGLVGYYQTYFRSANPTFCPPATFNVTNGIRVAW